METNESAQAHFAKPLTIALMIALQVVRASFGFLFREYMGSCPPPPPPQSLVKTQGSHLN